jgi:hypothetical protein
VKRRKAGASDSGCAAAQAAIGRTMCLSTLASCLMPEANLFLEWRCGGEHNSGAEVRREGAFFYPPPRSEAGEDEVTSYRGRRGRIAEAAVMVNPRPVCRISNRRRARAPSRRRRAAQGFAPARSTLSSAAAPNAHPYATRAHDNEYRPALRPSCGAAPPIEGGYPRRISIMLRGGIQLRSSPRRRGPSSRDKSAGFPPSRE